MHEHYNLGIDRVDRYTHRRRVAALAVAILVTFGRLAGVNFASARQVFDATLWETIQTVEAGSTIRQLALVGFAAVCIALLATGQRRRPEPKPFIAVPLGMLILVIAASALWAIDPQLTFRRTVALGLMLVGVYVCAEMPTTKEVIVGTLLFSGAFVATAVGVQVALGPFTPLVGSWRLAGIVHPVTLSWYCGVGAIAAVALARFRPAYRIPARWAAVGFIACLLLTKTRTGLVAAVVGIAVFWLLTSERRIRKDVPVAVTWLALLLFILALVLPGEYLSWQSIYTEWAEASSLGRTDAIAELATFTGRLPVWEASLALASQRPILGFGYSAFQSAELLPLFDKAAGWAPTSAHSGYIDALLSLGLVGLALFVFVLAASTVESIRMARHRTRYAFATAVFIWLMVNLALEAAVLFSPIFPSFLVFTLVVKIALFPDHGDELSGP